MPIIAAAATVFEQVYNLLSEDEVLTALTLGGGYPRVDEGTPEGTPDTQGARFWLLRELPDTTAIGGPMGMQVEVHEPDKGQGRWSAKSAIERIEWIIDLAKFEKPTGSIRIPIRAYWRATSGFVADDGWQTQKYIGSFDIGGH